MRATSETSVVFYEYSAAVVESKLVPSRLCYSKNIYRQPVSLRFMSLAEKVYRVTGRQVEILKDRHGIMDGQIGNIADEDLLILTLSSTQLPRKHAVTS